MHDLFDLANDIWAFLRTRKKYWLAPLIITLFLIGALVVLTHGTVLPPFIYALF